MRNKKKGPDEEPEESGIPSPDAVMDAIGKMVSELGIDPDKVHVMRLDSSDFPMRPRAREERDRPDIITPPQLEPSSEDKELVKKWAKKLTQFLHSGEDELHLKFDSGWVVENEAHPLYAWRAGHHTLPARELIMQLGIRGHVEGCTCGQPERPYLAIRVFDEDTEEEIEDSGSIEVERPRNIETIHMLAAGAALSFSKYGSI